MKKISKGIILIIATILLTGCVKSHTVTTIKSDKSMTLSADYLFSDKLIEMGANINSAVNKEKVEKMGYKYEEVKDNGYSGVKIIKEYKNIDDVSDSNGREVDLGDLFSGKDETGDKILFKVEKSFFKNKYTATFVYDSTTENNFDGTSGELDEEENATENDTKLEENETENENSNINNLGDMTALMSLASEMELSYVVNLPNKSLSNDATSKSEDEKTLTWKMATDGAGKINYSFELYNITNLAILGGAVLLVIIIIVVIILKKKKNKKGSIPTEGLIHTDFDPSIANKISETSESTQNVSNDITPSDTNVEVQNVPNSIIANENNIIVEPVTEVPTVQPESLEFTLPEEKTVEEVKQVNEINPVVKEPVFISPVIEQPEQSQVVQPETQVIQEIETPDIVDMNSSSDN